MSNLIKNASQIKKMKEAGRIVALVHAHFAQVIKPGISLNELDQMAYQIITENKAQASFLNHQDFPKTICASVNDIVVHAIPNDYVLKAGDIVTLDVGAQFEGYHGDGAWTYGVGEISSANQKLMDVTRQALEKGMAQVKIGNHIGDISAAICQHVYAHNMTIPKEFSGHGIGQELHQQPYVLNIGKAGTGEKIQEGMTIAIEPIVHYGKADIIFEKDGWTTRTKDGSMAAHYEHTVLVTKKGCQILTSLEGKEIING